MTGWGGRRASIRGSISAAVRLAASVQFDVQPRSVSFRRGGLSGGCFDRRRLGMELGVDPPATPCSLSQ
jgi:hypothetical protein